MTGARSVLVVTGTRADFGLWRPVLAALNAVGIDIKLLVMGMHLDERFGQTVEEVKSSGYPIHAEVPCTAHGDSRADMAVSIGAAIVGAAKPMEEARADWLLVLGDRGEQLGAALAALHLEIPVAHLHGGERTRGAVDDVVRDLISRIATLHFVSNDDAKQRLMELGISESNIEVSGGPGLDSILAVDPAEGWRVQHKYGVKPGRYLVVLQHPETRGAGDGGEQVAATLLAVANTDLPVIAILPNSDAGGRSMMRVLQDHAGPTTRVFASIPHDEFLALLRGAAALVGNSSSGIIEAPLLGVPVVNIGVRQEGRLRGDNVIDVPADVAAIRQGLRRALSAEFRAGLSRSSPYGDGHAAQRIANRLAHEMAAK